MEPYKKYRSVFTSNLIFGVHMGRAFVAAIVLAIAMFVPAGRARALQHAPALRHLDQATALMFGAESSSKMPDAIASLVETIRELSAQMPAAANVKSSIEAARQEIDKGALMSNEKVAAFLRDAYRDLNAGKAFQMQIESDDIADLLSKLRRWVDSARSLLLAGKTDESARVLLEVALIIVTPGQP